MNYTQLSAAVTSYVQNYETDFVANVPLFIRQAEQRIYNTVQFPSLRKNVTGQASIGNQYLAAPTDFLAVYSMAVYTAVTTTATVVSGQKVLTVVSPTGIQVGQNIRSSLVPPGTIVTGISSNTIALSDFTTGSGTGAITFQSDYMYLLNKDVNFIRQAYPTPFYRGAPIYYAIFGPATDASVPPELTDNLAFLFGPTPDVDYVVELHYYFYPESITVAADGETWLGNNFDTVLLYGALVEAYTYLKGEADLIQLYDAKYKEALAQAKRLGDGMDRQDAYRSGQYRQPVT
jgi:hypothetical protein